MSNKLGHGVYTRASTVRVELDALWALIDGGGVIVNPALINHNLLMNTHNLTTDIDHDTITNNHNLTTDIDHDTILNNHNLTTDIDHDAITNTHQGVAAGDSPTFTGLTLSGLAVDSALYTDGASALTSTAPTSGTIGFWDRSVGGVLTPHEAADDDITTTGIITAATFNATDEDNIIQIDGTTVFRTGDPANRNLYIGDNVATIQELSYNVCLGYGAGQTLDSISGNDGLYNVFIGYNSGSRPYGANNTGQANVGIGANTLRDIITGDNNAAIGYYSQNALQTGSRNIGVGASSMAKLTTGSDNVTIGYAAGVGKTGSGFAKNTFVGTESGREIGEGSRNVAIGYEAGRGWIVDQNSLLAIEGSESGAPLIGGDFSTNDVRLFGDVLVADPDTLGAEVLNETDFATHAKWGTVGDFDDTGGDAEYIHSGGSGTLTQTSGNMATSLVGDTWYLLVYTTSGYSNSNFLTHEITTGILDTAQPINLDSGTHEIAIKTKSSPGNFVISITSDGTCDVTIDDISLKPITGGDVNTVGTGTFGDVHIASASISTLRLRNTQINGFSGDQVLQALEFYSDDGDLAYASIKGVSDFGGGHDGVRGALWFYTGLQGAGTTLRLKIGSGGGFDFIDNNITTTGDYIGRMLTLSHGGLNETDVDITFNQTADTAAWAFPSSSAINIDYNITGDVIADSATTEHGLVMDIAATDAVAVDGFAQTIYAMRGLAKSSAVYNAGASVVVGMDFNVGIDTVDPTVAGGASLVFRGTKITVAGDLGTTGTTSHEGLRIDVSGTADINYGIFINDSSDADVNWAYYNSSPADNFMGSDDVKTTWGDAGATDSYVQFGGANLEYFSAGAHDFLAGNITTSGYLESTSAVAGQSAIASGLVVNEAGGNAADDDFRVETTNQGNAFVVDASADTVNTGTGIIQKTHRIIGDTT